MSYYRRKPIVVEAFQWTGDEKQVKDPKWACVAVAEGYLGFQQQGTPNVKLCVLTNHGWVYASRGEWIIKGVNGEIYPCSPDVFERTYEEYPRCRPNHPGPRTCGPASIDIECACGCAADEVFCNAYMEGRS